MGQATGPGATVPGVGFDGLFAERAYSPEATRLLLLPPWVLVPVWCLC
jgi:hypothetical protein